MKKLFRPSVIAIIFFTLSCLCTHAQVPQPEKYTYVNGATGILTIGQIANLNDQLYRLEKKYSVQFAICLLRVLPADKSIEDYAREIGRQWHVGNAQNGLVYVMAIKEHKQRLEVAGKLQGTITDAVALHLTDNLKPYLRSGAYYAALTALVSSIDVQLSPVTAEQKALGTAELKRKSHREISAIVEFLLFLVIFIGVVGGVSYLIIRRSRKREKVLQDEADARTEEREKQRVLLAEQANEWRKRAIEERYNSKVLTAEEIEAQQAQMLKDKERLKKDQQKKRDYFLNNNYVPIIVNNNSSSDSHTTSSSSDSNYNGYDGGSSNSSSDSSSSSSSSDNSSSSSSYGDWGSGSSDSGSSSSSSFDGGGSSNDW